MHLCDVVEERDQVIDQIAYLEDYLPSLPSGYAGLPIQQRLKSLRSRLRNANRRLGLDRRTEAMVKSWDLNPPLTERRVRLW